MRANRPHSNVPFKTFFSYYDFEIPGICLNISYISADIDIMDSESEDDAPIVMVSGKPYPIDEINDELIAQMTQQEKDTYIQVYQDHFSHMYD